MITVDTLARRVGVAARALEQVGPFPGATGDRVVAARKDLAVVLSGDRMRRAVARLGEFQGGFPASSMPEPSGQGGLPSDRAGELVVASWAVDGSDGEDPEPARPVEVVGDAEELDWCSLLVVQAAVRVYVGRVDLDVEAKRLERVTARLRALVLSLARELDAPGCRHCWGTNRHWSRLGKPRYTDLCRRCGDWRSVNGVLPQLEILRYLQVGKTPPRALLEKHRAKLPRTKRR